MDDHDCNCWLHRKPNEEPCPFCGAGFEEEELPASEELEEAVA